MIDRALANINPIQADTYYFQLYPLNLTIVGKESVAPPSGTTYRFTVFKGQQKFDESKLPIEANFHKVNEAEVMVMPKCPLNFYVPSFNKNKKVEFVLKLYQTENNEEYDLGEHVINIEPYVSEFRQDRTVRFELKSPFSEDYELEFQVYVERTRFALEKVVKDFKVERGLKSPLRERVGETVTPNMRKVLTGPRSPVNKLGPTQSPVVVDYPVSEDLAGSKQATEVQSSNYEPRQVGESQIEQSSWTAYRGQQSQIQTDKASDSASKKIKGMKSKDSQSSFFQEKSVKRERQPQNKSVKKENAIQNDKYSQDDVSEKKAPSVNLRLSKAVKTNAPAEVRLLESTRMSTGPVIQTPSEPTTPLPPTDWKQTSILVLFLTISVIVMYLAMHPSRKV